MSKSNNLLLLHSSLTVRLLVICLAFIQYGCTQDNNSPTRPFTTNQSPSASLSEASAPATAHLPEDEKDLPMSGTQKRSDFALIVAETDDDDLPDEISVCETNKICVLTLETGAKRMYQNGSWQTVDLIAVQDTDGEPGAEIVTVAYTSEGEPPSRGV